MNPLRELCPTATDAITLSADYIGKYWFECDVVEERDDPGQYVPELVELQAHMISLEYDEDKEVIKESLTLASKRNYLERISKHIEEKDNGVE